MILYIYIFLSYQIFSNLCHSHSFVNGHIRLQQVSENIAHACLFLARYHLNLKQIDEATTYARKATEYTEVRYNDIFSLFIWPLSNTDMVLSGQLTVVYGTDEFEFEAKSS